MVISVHGVLDEAAVRTIVVATTGALSCNWRVVVNLGAVTGYTGDGITALRSLHKQLPSDSARRVAYHAASEAGQQLLLAALTGIR